jgi:glycosyltransferase involved in cell wall biosynthesis
MMRVLYSFPTRLGTAGIGTTAWHQIVGLAEHGTAVTVVCASSERALPAGVRVIETLRPFGVKVPFRALGLARGMALHDLRAAAVLRHGHEELDVVHCWPLGAQRTLTTARALGIPALLERPNAHTRFAIDAVEEVRIGLGLGEDASSPHARRSDRLAREEREYALAERLLCPSEFVARTFRDEGFAADRLLRHRYGYDPARFSAAGRDARPRPFTAGFVGRGEPRKGLHLALSAWLESGAAELGRFLIAGAIDADYRRVLEPMLAHPSVQEHGHVSDPAALMRSCDVLVLPSLEEGSALVTYEARACGCVLAVSDRSGAPCADGVDALVHAAGDVAALAAHLRALATDRELCAGLRRASLAGVPELSWSKAGGALAAAYAETVNAAPQNPTTQEAISA